PENTDVMWQFREAVHGLADGSKELNIPVSGGNVSFYNQTGEEPILPTPVVGVLGVIDDVHNAIAHDLGGIEEPETLVLLGETKEEYGGSIWQQVSGGGLQGLPPQVNLANEAKLAEFFVVNTSEAAAHDLSEDGLAIAASERAQTSKRAVDQTSDALDEDARTALSSESASCALIATASDRLCGVLARAAELEIPAVVFVITFASGNFTLAGQEVAI